MEKGSVDISQLKFSLNSREIVWKQSLDEVLLWVPIDGGVKAREIKWTLQAKKLKLSIRDEIVIQHEMFGKVEIDESTYTLEDCKFVAITLAKAEKALTWEYCFSLSDSEKEMNINGGMHYGQLNPLQHEEFKKELTRQRFNEAYGGFDFSDAEFNGMAQDPRTFMGGVQYN